jgi:hypothetical protein
MYSDGVKYRGHLDILGNKIGVGIIVFPNGDTYEGEY